MNFIKAKDIHDLCYQIMSLVSKEKDSPEVIRYDASMDTVTVFIPRTYKGSRIIIEYGN